MYQLSYRLFFTGWVLLLLICPLTASANDWVYQIRGGILDHDVDNLWSGNSAEEGVDINLEVVFTPKYEILTGAIRPNLGASINTEGDTSKLYLGMVWEKEWLNGLFFEAGLGGAIHDGEEEFVSRDKKALGSVLQFRTSFELGYSLTYHHRLSVMFDHISNAELADPNEGLDTLGVRYSYRF